MPLLRYFVCVGGVLLALLLASDAMLSEHPLPAVMNATPVFPPARIHSDRKWPEAVVYDTGVPKAKPAVIEKAKPKDASRKWMEFGFTLSSGARSMA